VAGGDGGGACASGGKETVGGCGCEGGGLGRGTGQFQGCHWILDTIVSYAYCLNVGFLIGSVFC
jgi:hypothetical protein